MAGVFTTVVMVPGERIKCLLQVQVTFWIVEASIIGIWNRYCIRGLGLAEWDQKLDTFEGSTKYGGPGEVRGAGRRGQAIV